MSAFGGKADMPFALHMSAFDPKRTSAISDQGCHASFVLECRREWHDCFWGWATPRGRLQVTTGDWIKGQLAKTCGGFIL